MLHAMQACVIWNSLRGSFPQTPTAAISVQLADVYGLQARDAKAREAKAVWAAKADSVRGEVIVAHPQYWLAQASRGG